MCSGFPRDETDRETRTSATAMLGALTTMLWGGDGEDRVGIPRRSPSSGRTRPGRRRRVRWRGGRAMKGDAKEDGKREKKDGAEGKEGKEEGGEEEEVRFLQVRKADRARPPSSRGRTASTPPRTPRRTSSRCGADRRAQGHEIATRGTRRHAGRAGEDDDEGRSAGRSAGRSHRRREGERANPSRGRPDPEASLGEIN